MSPEEIETNGNGYQGVEILHALEESPVDMIFSVDQKGSILWCNQGLIQALNLGTEAITGKSLSQILSDETILQLQIQIQEVFQTGLAVPGCDVKLTTPEGERWFSTTLSPIKSEEVVTSVLVIARDITENKTFAASLVAFAHKLAHQLADPVTAILLRADAAQCMIEDGKLQEVPRLMDEVIMTGLDMKSLVESLLALAKARGEDLEKSSVDMRDIVAQVLTGLDPMIKLYNCRIEHPESWPEIQGVESLIKIVWTNYITNALKHAQVSDEEIIIQLGSASEGEVTKFWVEDNGPGIPEDKIFTLFETFTYSTGGHGLGLSIVKEIVQKLGGEVGVESELGKGSTFWFTLPTEATKAIET